MSAITAKAMNSTMGTGEILGLDVLLKQAMIEVMQMDIDDRSVPRGLVASDEYYYYLGKSGTHTFSMKCAGSIKVSIEKGSTAFSTSFSVKKNGTVVHNEKRAVTVSFNKGDSIQIIIGETTANDPALYIYASEVDLRSIL